MGETSILQTAINFFYLSKAEYAIDSGTILFVFILS